MRSKLLLLLSAAAMCLTALSSYAQTRYQDSVFASYTMSTVTYSSVYGYQMDIYQPTGDVSTSRPAIVLAHEGTFVTGDRGSDPTVVGLCQDLAHRGYVTISIDYTLVPLAQFTNLENADSAAIEVFRAVSDGKAAVRYLRKYASTYGIDTNNIFIGGNSAGAVLAMHYAYIDSLSELNVNPDFPSLVATLGGLEGNSGNPGYSSDVKGVISLAGGLNQVAWLGYCSKPIVMAQGTADDVVPYTCADPNVGIPVPLQLCGLGSCASSIVTNTPYYDTLTFPGQGHIPWDSDPGMFHQVDTLITGFLFHEVMGLVPDTCPKPSGIQNIANSATITLYPNPATSVLNIQSSHFISEISVVDEMGRTVSQTENVNDLSYKMNTSRLSPGIYFVRIYETPGQIPAVRKVIIE